MTRKNEPTKVEAAKTAKKSTTRKPAGVAFELSDDQIDQVSAGGRRTTGCRVTIESGGG